LLTRRKAFDCSGIFVPGKNNVRRFTGVGQKNVTRHSANHAPKLGCRRRVNTPLAPGFNRGTLALRGLFSHRRVKKSCFTPVRRRVFALRGKKFPRNKPAFPRLNPGARASMGIAAVLSGFCARQEKFAQVYWRKTRKCSAAWRQSSAERAVVDVVRTRSKGSLAFGLPGAHNDKN
jgi:hypothetical protein